MNPIEHSPGLRLNRAKPDLQLSPFKLIAMGAAGLSVAYHAKPAVRAPAMVQINTGGLDRLLACFTATAPSAGI